MCLPRRAPATSHLLVLLLGRVSGGIRHATCPLSKVYLVDSQNFWTGLPVPAPLAANAGTHAGMHAHARVYACTHAAACRTLHTANPPNASQ